MLDESITYRVDYNDPKLERQHGPLWKWATFTGRRYDGSSGKTDHWDSAMDAEAAFLDSDKKHLHFRITKTRTVSEVFKQSDLHSEPQVGKLN